jgi:hypothetical protein
MTFNDLKKGRIYYFLGSDAYYKVLDKGRNWACLLGFEGAHYVANPVIWDKDSDLTGLVEDFDDYVEDIFDNLIYLKTRIF